MSNYWWVIGGIYTDTGFHTIAKGEEEQVYGPYKTFEEAKSIWAGKSWVIIDDCYARYHITQGDALEPAPGHE